MDNQEKKTCPTVIQGNYSQGSDIFRLSSRGKQCMSMSFTFLVFCHAQNSCTITKNDLDSVLVAGDNLYHEIVKEHSFLLANELPNYVKFERNYFSSFVQNTYYGNMAEENMFHSEMGLSLEHALNQSFASSNACILIFHSSAIALMSWNGRFFVFDSHCRGSNGLCDPNGVCTLTNLDCFDDLCYFLRILCNSVSIIPFENVQFELNAMRIRSLKHKPKTKSCVEIYIEHNSNTRKRSVNFANSGVDKVIKPKKWKPTTVNEAIQKASSEKVVQETEPDSPITKNISSQNSNKSIASTLNSDEFVAIENFRKNASMGPTYLCSCCTQTWFRDGVRKANVLPMSEFTKNCLLGIKSNEDIEWVCCTCQKYLNLRKIPPLSVKKGCKFPEIPPELKLTEMEERLISPRIPFMQLMEKPRGGQKSLRGNVVNVPSDVNKTIKSLPRTLAETETIQVKLKRKLQFKHHVFHESVRPFKCIVALHWLLRNSAVFQNEGISIRENWNILEEQKDWFGYNEKTLSDSQSNQNEKEVIDGDDRQKMKTLKVGSQEIQTHCYIL